MKKKHYNPLSIRIGGQELKEGIHENRPVIYLPREAKRNFKSPLREDGTIVSWGKRGVLVLYKTGKSILTDQRDLFWPL